MESIDSKDLVFLDESGCNLAMNRAYGRSLKGTRVKDKVPNKGENITIIGTMNLSGMHQAMIFPGGTDRHAFEAFLKNFLIPYWNDRFVLVMDNLRVHRMNFFKKIFEEFGIKYLFLPPYSPDLNPIEGMWSKVKTLLRSSKARTYDSLQRAIGDALAKVTPSDARGWFARCGYKTVST
jgi:transposase